MLNELSCNVVRDLLPQYAEGLLSPESEKEVRRHLDRCKSCQQIFREMTDPEPQIVETVPEVDYLKKVRRSKRRFLAAGLAAAVLLGAGAWFFFRGRAEGNALAAEAARKEAAAAQQAAEAARRDTVNFDEASGTIVIFGKSADVNVEIPPEMAEKAKNLDAQYENFHLSLQLSQLQNDGELPLNELYEDYVNRTNLSLRFLRTYLKQNAGDEAIAAQAEKFVDLTVRSKYGSTNDLDRVRVELGSYYWHREELYLLALMDTKTVEWQQLGYVWYLGCCLDPYSDAFPAEFEIPDSAPTCAPYERVKGSRSVSTSEDIQLYFHAISWVCLKDGMYWGSPYESYPVHATHFYSGDKDGGQGNQMSVTMAASFIGWLTERYGFDRVSAFCCSKQTMEEAFGMDYDTAYAAWSAWILELFG